MQKSKITDNCKCTSTADLDCISRFKETRIQNFNNVNIGILNINSLVFKFEELRLLVTGIFNILIITETKLDDTFPLSQFLIDAFPTPYRLNRNRKGGAIIICTREDIPSKIVTEHCFPKDIEALFIEQNSENVNGCYVGFIICRLKKINTFLMSIQHMKKLY